MRGEVVLFQGFYKDLNPSLASDTGGRVLSAGLKSCSWALLVFHQLKDLMRVRVALD